MTDTILNLDDLTIPFANRGTATVIDNAIALPTDFATAYSAMPGASNLNGRTFSISGLQTGDSIGVSGSRFAVVPDDSGPSLSENGAFRGSINQTATTFSITFSGIFTSAGLDALIESLTFRTTDSRSFSTRDLTFSVNTPTFPQTGTVQITIGTPPPVEIGGLDDVTIPFESRFVRNLIDGDVTLPDSFATAYDGTNGSLNGRTLSITGLQFGDAIRFTPESGFVVGFPNTTLNGNPIASTSGNTNSLSLTFTTNFTAAQLEQLLQSMTFQAGPTNPAAASRTLTYSLNTPTALTGTVDITMSAPEARNLIEDMDNQNVVGTGNLVTLDNAITLSDEFHAAYAAPGSLNNLTMAITGWTGQQIQVGTVSGSGVSIVSDAGSFSNVYVGSTQVGALNAAAGTFFFNNNATAALVETLIESLTINPQLGNQSSRTVTVTIMTPTAPQFGTVTFTAVPFAFNDLRESVDVSYNTVLNEGLLLDADVTLVGNGPWGNGKIEVTGLGEGDVLLFNPGDEAGLFVEGSAIQGLRGGAFGGFFATDIAYLTTTSGSTFTITLADGVTREEIETIIESLRLVEATSGTRTLTISVSDQSGFVASDTVTVNVGYIPTLTDMVDTLDLTPAQATEGQLLDADVSFRVDSDLQFGGVIVTGIGPGEEIILRTDGGSPIIIENGTILIDGREVGSLFTFEGGPQIAFTQETTAKDVEAMIENLLFRTTAPSSVASRDITITISDTDGETDTQVVTVNILPQGAREMGFEILQRVNGGLEPIVNPAFASTGTTGDLNPADLFPAGTAPDSFVMRYSGLLNVGNTIGFGERAVIAFGDVPAGTFLVVNGVSYMLQGPEGRQIIDLAPGLHKISLQIPFTAQGGQIQGTTPTLTFGIVLPPSTAGELWPDYTQTDLFQNVSIAPDTLYRIEVTTTVTHVTTGDQSTFTDVFYVTDQDDVEGQIAALLQSVNPPPGSQVSQSFTTVTEVVGTIGSDTLIGTTGDDLLNGGAGDDLLLGSLGADTLDGGTGMNAVSYQDSNARVTVDLSKGVGQGGHAEGDVIRNVNVVIGSSFGDHLVGSAGNDTLNGLAGRDSLVGGAGDDLLSGGIGNDTMLGGEGNDLLRGGFGADILFGGEGNDSLRGNAGADTIDGGAGINEVSYAASADAVTVNLESGQNLGGDAAGDQLINIQQLVGSAFADTLIGTEAGADTLRGGNGNDLLDGNAGADRLFGDAGDDTLVGDAGADNLFGGAGNDSLSGGNGNDLLRGDAGADTIDGGKGIDTVSYAGSSTGVTVDLTKGETSGGDAQGDVLLNVERIIGSAHDDLLTGSAHADTLFGGAGTDIINGGAGNDVLFGGNGADYFVFSVGFGMDRIADLGAEDGIALTPDVWGDVDFGDVDGLIQTYGYQGEGYVELRLTEVDILRIDDITLQELMNRPEYFTLGG